MPNIGDEACAWQAHVLWPAHLEVCLVNQIFHRGVAARANNHTHTHTHHVMRQLLKLLANQTAVVYFHHFAHSWCVHSWCTCTSTHAFGNNK